MLRRLSTLSLTIVTLCCAAPSTSSAASAHDVNAARIVLTSGYETLRTVLSTWPKMEASLGRLNNRFAHECPGVGAGSPQNEAEQPLSYEVAGALWATAYRADAPILHRFIHRVTGLSSSDPKVNRRVYKFLNGLNEMMALQVPDICTDALAWKASGYTHVSSNTLQFDRHVESINVEIPSPKIADPFLVPSDRYLVPKLGRLITRFEEREFSTGQRYWDMLLETLAVPQ